jgi:OmcA/MtrC family decaheme c-type cytochrome
VDKHVVANASCNNCHDLLGGQVSQNSIHGRTRTGAEHCTACHNQYHIGTRTVEPVDMAYLGHQIHSGSGIANEPTHLQYNWASATIHPTRYMAYYPRDIKNCNTCHDSSVASGAERAHTKPSIQACGSCHNNVDFATGAGHTGGAQPNSNSCANCHAPGTNLGADVAHVEADTTGRHFANEHDIRYAIDSLAFDSATNELTFTWRLLIDDAPVEIATSGWTVNVQALVGWGHDDFSHSNGNTRPGNALQVNNIQSTADFAGGVYTSVVALGGEASFNGDESMIVLNLGGTLTGNGFTNLVAANANRFLTGSGFTARRQVVSRDTCTSCHEERYGVFRKHGAGSYHNDTTRCIICHNNNSTDIDRRNREDLLTRPQLTTLDGNRMVTGIQPDINGVTDGLAEQATNFMVMIHGIHGQGFREAPIGIATQGGPLNYKDARRYPGRLANCNQCHTGTSYYGMGSRGTTFETVFDDTAGFQPNQINDHIKTTAAMAACSSCHDSTGAKAHMKLMGGDDNIDQAGIDTTAFETCGTCHGAGRTADVRVVHGLN